MPDDPKRDALAELLKSPLERERRAKSADKERRTFGPDGGTPGPPGSQGLVRTIATGLVVGGLLGIVAFWMGGRVTPIEQVIAPVSTTASAATTTAAPVIDSSLLPTGYVAVDELIGIKAERFLRTDDRIVVSFSVAVREGLDPNQTRGFTGGVWVLESGGVSTPGVAEYFDPEAPGVFSVEFANDIPPIDDSTVIRLEGVVERNFTTVSVDRATSFPVDLGGSQSLDLASGVAIEIDEFTADLTGGRVAWRMNASPEVRASLDVSLLLRDGQNDTTPAVYLELGRVGIRANFGATARPDPLTRDGVEVLIMEVPPDAEEPVTEANIFFEVFWGTVDPRNEIIPLAGLRETALDG